MPFKLFLGHHISKFDAFFVAPSLHCFEDKKRVVGRIGKQWLVFHTIIHCMFDIFLRSSKVPCEWLKGCPIGDSGIINSSIIAFGVVVTRSIEFDSFRVAKKNDSECGRDPNTSKDNFVHKLWGRFNSQQPLGRDSFSGCQRRLVDPPSNPVLAPS